MSSTAFATPTCPTTARPGGGWRWGLDAAARQHGADDFAGASEDVQTQVVDALAKGKLHGEVWDELPPDKTWKVVSRAILSAFYSHPWAWNEIGFGGPAYPRGYARLGVGQRESWEGAPSVRGRSRQGHRATRSAGNVSRRHELRTLLRGALRPPDNDSAFLLDVHRRAVPRERMARYDDSFSVDLVIVGAGAGGGTLAQRLARRGWKVVVLESGPFWDPDQDWVSDEAGSHRLYWTDDRVTGGSDPVELGKNNCGHGVGGSMVHYAGYCPRFHPSDFEVRSRDGVGEDWPIRYPDLKRHYERLELELPVAGDFWPWGDPHRYPHTPHPIAGGADAARAGARKLGIEMRVGPVGITNGAFGNRPHCIYRGYCLQGCKVNAKASPLVTHIPDAIEHGAEIRAHCMAAEVVLDDATGRVTGVRYLHEGSERFQRAEAVAVAGYSIETPRLLLNSTSAPVPPRPGEQQRPGRAVRDGAGRAAGGRPVPR